MTHPGSPRPAAGIPPADAEWDRFVASSEHGHLLQAAAWGRFRQGQGWRTRRVWLPSAAGRPALGAQLLVRGGPGLRWAYLPRGPVAAPDDDRLDELWRAIGLASRDCAFVRLEPHWADGPKAQAALARPGLRPAPPVQPPSTLLLDLADGPDALLAAMKPKWRYNIGLASRRGVVVRLGAGASDWEGFETLVQGTARRNGFHARPQGYYRGVGEAFGASARLYLAELEGEMLAGILVVHWAGTATYLYGGSGDRHRDVMPNHLLQWRAIQDACAAGLGHYDFWGIPDAVGRAAVLGRTLPREGDDGDGLWGVWGFKRGFGGRVWRAVGAADLVHAPLRHALATRLMAGGWRGLLRGPR